MIQEFVIQSVENTNLTEDWYEEVKIKGKKEYQELFEWIGCLKGYEYEAKFQTSDMNMQVRPPRPIPLSIKERVKKELEEIEDNGIIKKVYYPTPISSQMVKANQRNKTKEPMIIKEIPSLPWERVAADIFSIKGKNYLLITDNCSGFIDLKKMKTMNYTETIESL
ncbi:K02A2.6-like [Cordylochernes scorpioides]|uniref:K02A2.6-like n=1 Tax=Cordylochernes scorpioides TaxID=51811 RepID=A0ABY6LK39_9ARAC|nr:K02A2.6-like [Cordylochernes scorpioides]